jgi:metallophosphoesterase (TIGR00282 family)
LSMPADTMKALLLGDVYGASGCRAVSFLLPQLKQSTQADIVIVNGENATEGFSLALEEMNTIFKAGADVITSGNHIWGSDDIRPFLDTRNEMLRPANYPPGVPGHGSCIVNGIGVINIQGRVSMPAIDDPFRCAATLVGKLSKEVKAIFVDFHAECPQEKEAMAYFLDGSVTAVVGTHTHVQTADQRILAKGTAYITDLGLCGPLESVIGSEVGLSISKQLEQMPYKPVQSENPSTLQGVIVTFDSSTGKALSIQRLA